MTVEVENSCDAARAPAFTLPWRSISQGAPAWTDDAAIRVVVVTADDDFGGVQMHDIPAMDFHVTDNDTPDEVGTEVTQVCTHWAYRHELWPASLPRPEVAPAPLAIPTDEMAEAFIAAANQFPACGEDEPWLRHAYRKCKAGLAAALAVQAANGQASAGTQAAPAGVDMAQIALAAAPAAEVAAPVLVDDMKQELMALYNQLMKQGRGMHYWNYAAAVLNRYRGTLPANPAGAPDMVSVKKEDANNYCRILAALGMREEGDPVAKVQSLLAAAAAPVVHTISDDSYCALQYVEKALAAIANREELVGDTIELVDTIGKAAKRAKAALVRLQTVAHHFDTVEKSQAAAPVAHPHHCTARSADGACEECELHAQELAEWSAEQKAAAQVVLPEPDAWRDGARFALEAVSKVNPICWLTDSMKMICIRQAADAVIAERGRMRHQLATATEQPAQARVAELESVMTHVQEEFKKYGNNFPDGFDCRVFRFVDDVLAGVTPRKAKAAARDAGTLAAKHGGAA